MGSGEPPWAGIPCLRQNPPAVLNVVSRENDIDRRVKAGLRADQVRDGVREGQRQMELSLRAFDLKKILL